MARATERVAEGEPPGEVSRLIHALGFRYWTASVLPALVGTTLPVWLRPPGFSFRWVAAGEFLLAVVLFHAGFALVHEFYMRKTRSQTRGRRYPVYAGGCIVMACFLGLHLESGLDLHEGVYEHIFLVFGLSALFTGFLYVLPPLRFWERAGGEIVVAQGLGFLPVLGAYLIQVGDITRTVYVAALPLVFITGLWVWTEELASREVDEKAGRRTLVWDFGSRLAGQWGVLLLMVGFFLSVAGAVVSESVAPSALVLLVLVFPAWRMVAIARKEYAHADKMAGVVRNASGLHFVTGLVLALSSLVSL